MKRRSGRPFSGLALLAGVVIIAYVAFVYLGPLLPDTNESHLHEAIAGQRITELEVLASIMPSNADSPGSLSATADLTITILEADRRELLVLLDPGYTIEKATVNGKSVRCRRNGEALQIRCPEALREGETVSVQLTYSGSPSGDTLQPALIGSDRVILPHLSLWHPTDLTSFFLMQGYVEIPEDWTAAIANPTINPNETRKRKRVAWEEKRPVLGATFIAGPYQSLNRVHGAVQCGLLWDQDAPIPDPQALLNTVGEAYSYLRVLFESDGFDHVVVVVDSHIDEPFNGGNSVLGLPPMPLKPAPERFATVARQTAHNWWGSTITGRWFTQQPEAAAWIVHGFAEYSAWLALQGARGNREFLQYVETLRCPPTVDFPMKLIDLQDALRPSSDGTKSDPSIIQVRQAYTLSAIAAQTGQDKLISGCRNLLRIHRYRPVSYTAVLQELELASESDLRETFRVWFERGGTFDYAIDDVVASDGGVRILVSNPGDIPMFGELKVALVSGSRVTQTAIEPGANGGSFLLPVDAPVDTIILDPAFTYPDMLRENNVWPRRVLPRAVQGFANGEILVTANPNPMGRGADRLAMLKPDLEHSDRVNLPSVLTSDPVGRSDATMFLLDADPLYAWNPSDGAVDEIAREGFGPLGWVGDIAFLQNPGPAKWYRWAPGSAPVSIASNNSEARPGSLVPIRAGNQSVYVSAQSSQIRRVSWEEFRDEPLECPAAASNLAWNAAGGFVVYISIVGAIIKLDPVSETYETILQLEYAPLLAKVSPEGAYVAWLDLRNQLWYCNTARTQPKVAAIEGEPVSLSWMNDETLLVLTAEPLSAIPAHAHATYSLWRVDAIRHRVERLPVNPSKVF
ncbi:MAG: hypothetical protein AMXMBFR82_02860 [Candidatus Hydrogenedentota bacterium]